MLASPGKLETMLSYLTFIICPFISLSSRSEEVYLGSTDLLSIGPQGFLLCIIVVIIYRKVRKLSVPSVESDATVQMSCLENR